MKSRYDPGELDWMLTGWTPYVWRHHRSIEAGVSKSADVSGVPVSVPGSVQGALRDAGIVPDWNVGLNARECEWVENRHWIYTARLPDAWLEHAGTVRLRALGLDDRGWVLLNGREIGTFRGSFVPHVFDLSAHLRDRGNTLQIVFDCPPRWLGQIGYTPEMTEWKPRFNYFWDWTSRLVQIGIWDDLLLEVIDGPEIAELECRTGIDAEGRGHLYLRGVVAGDAEMTVHLLLERDGNVVHRESRHIGEFVGGMAIDGLPIELWWPNGEGAQPLYTVRCLLVDANRTVLDEVSRRVGFASVRWEACRGAPPDADPWICVVNGKPVFSRGVNWTPILPNFADVTPEQYRALLQTYRDLGCTMLRVWGGAFLEKDVFYDFCDEMGLLVWQEFPLSSSGLDNRPPDDPRAIEDMAEIAQSYIERRRHHVSLVIWCGGNELQDPRGTPVDSHHPMIARLARVAAQHDPQRRFLPTSPSGPTFGAEEERFGQGVHWDVHGPWRVKGDVDGAWTRFWRDNDALFHSEIGAPGAAPADLIRRYRGDLSEVPGTTDNPLWRRTSWWIEWPRFVEEHGREPMELEEYVAWSQRRQRIALGIAARSARSRFPRCGGFLLWMGHDSFPCTANTSIIDFDGNPKPAAIELGTIFRGET